MAEGGAPPGSRAGQPAHEIRRFESAVWSLYMLSENESLPAEARAACRAAADHAATEMGPGHPGVTALMQLVIEVGGGEAPPSREMLLARLRDAGWDGDASALGREPPPLVYPPPRNLVSDRMRGAALDKILADIELALADKQVPPEQRKAFAARLAALRAGPGDVRSKTDRAWALLGVIERNREARARRDDAAPGPR
jgi:hypothetical protein